MLLQATEGGPIFYYRNRNVKVLLINSNRYASPPVPPIGLEYVAAALEEAGHEAAVLDLCFSALPIEEIDRAIEGFRPDVAGLTVRNIDTVLYHTNEFFLDEIRGMIDHIRRRHGLKIVIGGTGVSADPGAVLEYLRADYAVDGPGEDAISDVIGKLAAGRAPDRITRGRYRYDLLCPRKSAGLDYEKYYDRGGVAGFETHRGCSSSCIYCIEANTNVSFRSPEDVMLGIRRFSQKGYRRFHLCDPEFNEDLDYCLDFCTALRKEDLGIEWAVYMKPANFTKRLIRLMKESGVSLITLTVDSWKKCPLYYDDIEKIIFSSRSSGINVAVDFLAGFPYETEETLLFYLDMFRRLQPDSVGINTHIRLYRQLQITKLVMGSEELKRDLTGATEDATLIRPVFYNRIGTERLKQLIGGDELFRIEGLEKRVNYQRAGQ
jgi:hypothetical protein